MATDKIRLQLECARDDLRRRLERIDRDVTHRSQPLPADAPDRAQLMESDEVLEQLGNETSTQLAQYEHALTRLEQGYYGTCETCGFAIEPARRSAVPHATRCASVRVVACGVRRKRWFRRRSGKSSPGWTIIEISRRT